MTDEHLALPPSPLDTAEFPHEEILRRLEMGRLVVKNTREGSQLGIRHVASPATERRRAVSGAPHRLKEDRRRFKPLNIPTLFPASGPILVLVVGGFADQFALTAATPLWEDAPASALVWQALARAGLLYREEHEGELRPSRHEPPPRTQGIAMTYAGFRARGEVADFERIIHPWNVHRLQTLMQACWQRSTNRLKIITLGEAARFMTCACIYGMPDIPVLSLPEPTTECLARNNSREEDWVEWAADLMVIGRPAER